MGSVDDAPAKDTISRERLPEVVAEVDRRWQAQREALDVDETRAVLAEVGLPPELLEEALAEVRARDRRRALRWRATFVGMAVLLALGAVAGAVVVSRGRSQASASAITAGDATLSDERSAGRAVSSVDRSAAPELRLTVELGHVVVGDTVPLTCDWVGPDGAVAHRNAWSTRPIDRDPFTTHCRYQVPSSAPEGSWHVTLAVSGRALATREFAVQTGAKPVQ